MATLDPCARKSRQQTVGKQCEFMLLIAPKVSSTRMQPHSIGVDEVVDYITVRFENVARNIDIVLDPFGGGIATRSLAVLGKGGVLVSLKDVSISVAATAWGKRAEYLLTRGVDAGRHSAGSALALDVIGRWPPAPQWGMD
jgi:NADPH:quinone reductase-like Zn-dependent oxidoreductase